jgi:cytochrome c553
MKRLLLPLALWATLIPAHAQEGDPAAGQAKAATCAACHGPDGNSANPEWPKIAGQHAGYLERQLMAFKDGKERNNAMMAGMVAPLSEQDMKNLAAYYAGLSMNGGFAAEELAGAGEQLYQGGNPDTGVPACMSCHGPAGEGDPLGGFPRLAGQHAAYTRAQLEAYRTGARATDPKAMMREIALKMTPGEMAAVASYINGLH